MRVRLCEVLGLLALSTVTPAGLQQSDDDQQLTLHAGDARLLSRISYLEARTAMLEAQLSAHDQGDSEDDIWGRSRRLASAGGRTTIVFNMGTDVSLTLICTVMLIVIAVTVSTEKIVHRARRIPDAYLPIVHKLEEEFMVLGAVSFLIVIVEVSANITHDQLLNIEFAHLLLFFAAVALVAFALKQLFSMAKCQAHWDRLERCDKAAVADEVEKQEHEARHLLHQIGRSIVSFFRPFEEFDARENAEHLVM